MIKLVTYACETWILKEAKKNVFIREKILKKIIGPNKDPKTYGE